LARGFIIAGVSTVAATLIDLDTNVSLEFANRFYNYLREGLTISCSFTRTIRDLKNMNDYRTPDSWGPFILFGSGFKTLKIA
jgi:CHAT domain-containing protein